MTYINHINLKNEDGQVYCCMRNRVVEFDKDQLLTYCVSCKMFGGTARGQGVECFWDDMRGRGMDLMVITDPQHELTQLQSRKINIT